MGRTTRAFGRLRGPADEPLPATPIRAEQSNTSVIFGDRLILKLFRRPEPGVNPDLELGALLTERRFAHSPAVAGSLDYRTGDGAGSAAILQEFVPNEGDMWDVARTAIGSFLEQSVAQSELPTPERGTTSGLLELSSVEPPFEVRDRIGSYLDTASLLGTRIGELHRTLAAPSSDPAVAPESFSGLYVRSLYQSIRASVRQSLRLLELHGQALPGEIAADARQVLERRGEVEERLARLLGRRIGGQRIRIHGDLHAGQVLSTGRDVLIIDFEGEPTRPLGERRLKRSALVDVAGMLRSFHYAAGGATLRSDATGSVREEDRVALEAWSRYWSTWVSATFLRAYRAAAGGDGILPGNDEEWATLLDVFLLNKAFFELDYELNNRPDWIAIPLGGILRLLDG